jgi:hypothetical protein
MQVVLYLTLAACLLAAPIYGHALCLDGGGAFVSLVFQIARCRIQIINITHPTDISKLRYHLRKKLRVVDQFYTDSRGAHF